MPSRQTNYRPAAKAKRRTEILSYNIHHGEGMDGNYDLRRVAGDIWAIDADIVGLQELDWNYTADSGRDSRSEFDKQLKLLSRWLNMEFEFGATLDLDPVPESGGERRKYGIGVLSSYAINQTEFIHLPTAQSNEQRGLLGVNVDVGDTPVWFYTTHLGLTSQDRQQQVERILKRLSEHQDPVVVSGDFNAESGSVDVIWPMVDDYIDIMRAVREETNTIPAPYQDHVLDDGRRIDYLFCSDDCTPIGGRVVQTVSSDHLPVTATLQVE